MAYELRVYNHSCSCPDVRKIHLNFIFAKVIWLIIRRIGFCILLRSKCFLSSGDWTAVASFILSFRRILSIFDGLPLRTRKPCWNVRVLAGSARVRSGDLLCHDELLQPGARVLRDRATPRLFDACLLAYAFRFSGILELGYLPKHSILVRPTYLCCSLRNSSAWRQ